ncbi:MAG: carboxypeptidase regulatory-like domain-containing protein [Acidobacteriia bacterium]|nr:carboxypeptidase regulatory-like domain-containing protein [Terriglobia bacterium]
MSFARTQWLSLSVLFLAAPAFQAIAQTNQGAISGNVLDPSGALVPNVAITAKEEATGTTYSTVSSSAGAYAFPNVRIGRYDITATAPGFKAAQLTGVVVQVSTTASLNITLETGAVTETVTVSGNAPTVDSTTADVGTVVTTRQVLDLPLPLGSTVQAMRSPEAFVFLVPGTVGPGTNGAGQPGTTNGGTFESKISGGQNYGTEILLDGASMFRSENGSSFDETAPSVEALGEYRVETSTMPAMYGRTTGGIEVFGTRSGTNTYHGDAYELFRNEDLDANTWFNNLQLSQTTDPNTRANFQRPLDKQNDYGVTLGGPVWIPKLYNGKDKTFFFFSWEQFRQNVGGVSSTTLPTAAEKSGDFSALLDTSQVLGTNPCDGTPIYAGQIFNPATTKTVGGTVCRTAFQGNRIPSNQFSAIGQKILSYYPDPLNGSAINNYSFAFSYPILDTTMTIRGDQNISTNNKLFLSYSSRDNVRLSTTPIFANPAGSGRNQDFFTHYYRLGEDYSISPSLLNHVNLGYNRTNSTNVGAGARFGGNWDQTLGITGVTGGRTFPGIGIAEGPITGIGDSVENFTIDNGFRINDTLSWNKGKHTMMFGVDLRHQQYSPISNSGTGGNFNFRRAETAATVTTNGLSGNAVASALLGLVDNANTTAYAGQAKWLSNYVALFAQDSFKVTPTFTLNYGLRWDVDQPRAETHGDTSNISLAAPNPGAAGRPGALVFAGVGPGRNGNVDERWANTFFKDFGPRVGFAWAPSALGSKTVVRGGYGIIYGALVYADFGARLRTGFQANPSFVSPDGLSPAFNIGSGFPAYGPPPNLDPSQLNDQNPDYIDPSFGRPAMVQNWSFEIQQQLATDLILDVAYVGQHSTHLRSNFDATNSITPNYFGLGNVLNQPVSSPQAQAAGIGLPYAGFSPNFLAARALTPFPQYNGGFNTDCCMEDLGQSTFNALEVSLRRRFRNGLNLLASYTWSKTMTDADSSLPFFATLHGGGSPQDPFNKKLDKAISNQDVPSNLVISYLYELPIGKGKKFLSHVKGSERVFGGWEVAGIQSYHSGQPFSFCCATGIPYFSGAIRFSQVPDQPLLSQQFTSGNFNPVTDPMFNKAAFIDPNAPARIAAGGAYQFGTMARTIGLIRSFFYEDEDFNILKHTRITEKTDLLFEANLIDAFNRHIFDRPPDLNANDPITQFGRINPNALILGPRRVQLQLKLVW